MPKNMTRASVALTAAATLVAGAFAGAPAFAAQADTSFVALAPTDGESYNVLAIAGQDFSLSANQASSITATGRTVKFLISDPNDVADVAYNSVGIALTPQVDDNLGVVLDDAADTIRINDPDLSNALSAGERIVLGGALEIADADSPTGTCTKTVIDANTVVTVSAVVAGTSVTLKTKDLSAITLDSDTACDTWAEMDKVAGAETVKVLANAKSATTKSFVVETGVDTNTSDKVLKLENLASTATVSVDVTAWVDDNGNGVIDTTEYASPKRTVTWVRPSTVVPTLTWTPVVIGDEKMAATVTLSPSINFDQQATSNFEVDFERQGSSDVEGTDDSVTGVTETWDGVDEEWSVEAILKQTADNTPWTGITKQGNFDETGIANVAKAGKVVTITTSAAHTIKVNDRVTVTAADDNDTSVNAYAESIFAATNAVVTAVTSTTFTYSVASNTTDVAKTSEAAGSTNKKPDGTQDFNFTVASFAYATAGDYKATVKLGGTPAKIGSTFVISAGAQVASGVKNVATVTANVSAGFAVRALHVADVQVTTTVTNADGVAVGAGVPVSIAVTETSTGIVTVNGLTVTSSRTIPTTTNASGQVVITVKNTSGVAGETVQLAVSSQGFSDTDTLTWTAAAYALQDALDNSTTGVNERSVAAGGEVAFNLRLLDQWGAAPTGEFRVKATGAGTRYDFVSYASMTNGAVNWTLTDAAVDASDLQGTVVFTVQQKNTAGSWVTPTGTAPLIALKGNGDGEIEGDTVNINVRSASGSTVSLNADGVSSADLSVASAIKALVAADTRNPGVAANDLSLETNDVTATITGTIKDKFTGVAQAGSAVTLSGNAGILFENGVQAAFGSITVIADGSGTFSVNAYSNAGLTDTVVTVTSNGASNTVKLTFTGAAADGGTTLEVTAPASAASGTTFQVSAVLKDKYGNGVKVDTAGDVKVTYTGPGLVVGTLPNTTDKDGKLTFSVLLGSNDRGSAVVTVSYDQNSDDDFLDAKDLTVSKTIAVGTGAASGTGKVNVGSFNGKLVVYASGLNGKRISWKVGGNWGSQVASSNYAIFNRPTPRAGVTLNVTIYVDGVSTLTKSVVTR